jgi:hypothetical protein
MNIKSERQYHEIRKTIMIENLRKMSMKYQEKTNEAWKVLTYANDMLYFKRKDPKRHMGNTEYNQELKAIVNMATIYFCALYEGFTRDFFKTLLYFMEGMEEQVFEKKYYKFNFLKKDIMENRLKIFLERQFKEWDFLSHVYHERGQVTHKGRDFKPDFEIINTVRNVVLHYISFIETTIYSKLHL